SCTSISAGPPLPCLASSRCPRDPGLPDKAMVSISVHQTLSPLPLSLTRLCFSTVLPPYGNVLVTEAGPTADYLRGALRPGGLVDFAGSARDADSTCAGQHPFADRVTARSTT